LPGRAGYQCILELLHPDPQRLYPDWHPRHGQTGSPRLFLTSRCTKLLEQLRTASVKAEGKDAPDIVDPDWESQHGHAHAALATSASADPVPHTNPNSQPTTPLTTEPTTPTKHAENEQLPVGRARPDRKERSRSDGQPPERTREPNKLEPV
jgi:hypothetical protein